MFEPSLVLRRWNLVLWNSEPLDTVQRIN